VPLSVSNPEEIGIYCRDRIKDASGDEAETSRYSIVALDQLINEGWGVRSNEEIESEYQRLDKERRHAKGSERLGLELRFAILKNSVPFLRHLSTENAQDKEENPQSSMDRGHFAAGNFLTYSENEKKTILEMARNDQDFVEGFLEYSHIPMYNDPDRNRKLTPGERKAIFKLALASPRNMRAFGRSRGKEFPYLPSQDRKRMLDLIAGSGLDVPIGEGQSEKIDDDGKHRQFSRGIGEGVGFHFFQLTNEDLAVSCKLIDESTDFAEGAMNSLNCLYGSLSGQDKEKFWDQYGWKPKYARMVGITFGLGFTKMSSDDRRIFIDFVKESEYFSEGFGYGFGLIADKLSDIEKDPVEELLQENVRFRKGYDEAKSLLAFDLD
jgi:hypothetical protein